MKSRIKNKFQFCKTTTIWEIDGEILSTPSHSNDSISLVLDNGTCIVGDLEPIDYLEAYDDNVALKKDWETILSYNPKVIYYAHANEKLME